MLWEMNVTEVRSVKTQFPQAFVTVLILFFRSELDSKVNRGLVHTHLRTPWVLQGVLGQRGLYIEQLWTLSQKYRN